MSQAADPYRAGLELGETLAPIAPEAVFLATTIDYGSSSEILEGLHDGAGVADLAVIGSTGDGCYGSLGVGLNGASALGLSSRGKVAWRVFTGSGIAADAEATVREILDRITAERAPSLVYLVCDFRTDAALIERVVRDYPDTPIIGGLAADDDRLQESVLYANREALTDGVAALAAYGPLSVWTRIANNMTPMGTWGTVDDATGTIVRGIDGMAATDFIEHAIGKPVLRSDRAVICLRLQDPDRPGQFRLRSVVPDFAGPEEHVGLFGGIRIGDQVQVCVPDTAQILRGVDDLATNADGDGIRPDAALMVSCAGRKWFLGQQVQQEVSRLTAAFGDQLPVAGFASFGELGPQGSDNARGTNGFHNMSLVLTLIGS